MVTLNASDSTGAHERLNLLGVRVSAVTIPQAVEIIAQWIAKGTKTYVCVAPASTLVDCQKNAEYKDVVNNAGMVTPDGMPVVWLGRAAGNTIIQRTYGPDLMEAVTLIGQTKGWRHFWYGAQDHTLTRLEASIQKRFPAAKIVGRYAPPFTASAQQENPDVIRMINEAKPDIVWVGLGSPKQDFWMKIHRPLLDAPVIIGVGAAFDFLSGQKPQAPKWMQRSGLEWMFRLASEPKRLWRRYLIGNTEFIFYVIKHALKQSKD